eukprot:CAMPEP_0116886376 /NCGR_PEP_ID=MMETSP0463-20121206/20199_1 /TAXON_ID=181622 /ORGANISM="Strombidinopsis sp, Strain SopsisLIS2011" /LENGTH=56 /DNA_ID=CAMNT_0004546681 /DNA_START=25 /DNA_END=195 /DNA_ORIENTATION=+
MTFVQKKQIASSADRDELRKLNREYSDCLAKEFLPEFFSGKQVDITKFCVDLRSKM